MTTQQDKIERRVVEVGRYIVENKCTVRECAEKIGVSKSTIHNDVRNPYRLREIDSQLYNQVEEVLETNLNERNIRGGLATKKRYEEERSRV